MILLPALVFGVGNQNTRPDVDTICTETMKINTKSYYAVSKFKLFTGKIFTCAADLKGLKLSSHAWFYGSVFLEDAILTRRPSGILSTCPM